MKLSVTRSELTSKLSLVSRALSTRHAIQALSGVLVTVEAGQVEMRATDNDLGIRTKLDATAEGDGTMLIPGRLFSDVTRSLGAERVELEPRTDQGDIELRCGASRFHLRSLPSADFPPFPQAGDGVGVKVPAQALVETVETVARAASRDDMRPVLTGVMVTISEGVLTMVATDSYRLSVKRTPVEGQQGSEFEANIPARALSELSKVVSSEAAEEVEIVLQASQAIFRVGGVELSTVLIDGQFPNYKQLLPESFEHDVRLNRPEFLEVTRRVGQLAQRNVPLKLSFQPGELTISASTPDLGDAEESMPVAFEGESMEIGFNPDYLIDGIDSVSGDEVLLRLISPLRPGLIEAVDGSDFTYLVMPIRLNS